MILCLTLLNTLALITTGRSYFPNMSLNNTKYKSRLVFSSQLGSHSVYGQSTRVLKQSDFLGFACWHQTFCSIADISAVVLVLVTQEPYIAKLSSLKLSLRHENSCSHATLGSFAYKPVLAHNNNHFILSEVAMWIRDLCVTSFNVESTVCNPPLLWAAEALPYEDGPHKVSLYDIT